MKIPKLRFKEFYDSWEEKSLNDILEISKLKYNPLKDKEVYRCIELECLSQETGQVLKTFNSKEQKSIKNKFLKDQILFGKLRPYLRKYWYSEYDGVCSSEIWIFTSQRNYNRFIYQLIQTDKFIDLTNISTGTKMPRADWSLMKNECFYIPSLPEQKKIGSFLSSIDKKIELLYSELENLKLFKKGLLQRMFV